MTTNDDSQSLDFTHFSNSPITEKKFFLISTIDGKLSLISNDNPRILWTFDGIADNTTDSSTLLNLEYVDSSKDGKSQYILALNGSIFFKDDDGIFKLRSFTEMSNLHSISSNNRRNNLVNVGSFTKIIIALNMDDGNLCYMWTDNGKSTFNYNDQSLCIPLTLYRQKIFMSENKKNFNEKFFKASVSEYEINDLPWINNRSIDYSHIRMRTNSNTFIVDNNSISFQSPVTRVWEMIGYYQNEKLMNIFSKQLDLFHCFHISNPYSYGYIGNYKNMEYLILPEERMKGNLITDRSFINEEKKNYIELKVSPEVMEEKNALQPIFDFDQNFRNLKENGEKTEMPTEENLKKELVQVKNFFQQQLSLNLEDIDFSYYVLILLMFGAAVRWIYLLVNERREHDDELNRFISDKYRCQLVEIIDEVKTSVERKKSSTSINVESSSSSSTSSAKNSSTNVSPSSAKNSATNVSSSNLSTKSANTSRFWNEYTDFQVLGQGGYAVVFQARNRLDQRETAIKRILLDNEDEDKVTREVVSFGRLVHPNVVAYYHSWKETISFDYQKHLEQLYALNDKLLLATDCESQSLYSYTQSGYSVVDMSDASIRKGKEQLKKLSVSTVSSDFKNIDISSSSLAIRDDRRIFNKDKLQCTTTSTLSDDIPSVSYLYILMELCNSGTLRDYLDKGNEVFVNDDYVDCFIFTNHQVRSLIEVKRIFKEMLLGIQYIHNEGCIHRDLKPSNIFMQSKGKIKIGDFGLVVDEKARPDLDQTKTNNQTNNLLTDNVGTELYMSPEQKCGSRQYDNSVDIYAAGLILFELLHPFRTLMERHIDFSRLKTQRTLPEPFARHYPTFSQLLLSMVHHNCKERPSATSILKEIDRIFLV
ncbi:hypothetical protein SNEBB_003177 [Seison nebaliae]|nr:hypothetical protein SNEBB_003177 [Seison nebaliae]